MSAIKIAAAAVFAVILPIVLIAAAAGGIASMLTGTSLLNCAPIGSPAGVAGYRPDQITNVAMIVALGKQLNVPQQGWVVAITAAMAESGLRTSTTATGTASGCSSNALPKDGAPRHRS